MWLLPLVTGVAVYHFAAAGGDAGGTVLAGCGEEVREKPRTDVAAMIDELTARLEKQQEDGDAELSQKAHAMTGEELRWRLAVLRDLKTGRWDEWRAVTVESEALARELGQREKETGVRWLLENFSKAYFFGMDAWAGSDPEGALEFVAHSDFARPCSKDALMTVLNAQAKQGPEALRSAVGRLPLEAFNEEYRSDIYGNETKGDGEGEFVGLEMPEDAALKRVWRDSGAARAMADGGLQMRDLFEPWFEDDPAAALENWATWPWLKDDERDRDFTGWLYGRARSDEAAEEAKRVLAEATPETRARAIEALSGEGEEDRATLRQRFPELFPEAAAPGP
jgi:hypothetical protein